MTAPHSLMMNFVATCRSGDHDYIGSCTTTLADICPERLVFQESGQAL